MSLRYISSLRSLQPQQKLDDDDELSSHRSILGEHDLDERVTSGMAPLLYTAARSSSGAVAGGGVASSRTIPTHINEIATPKSLLLESTSQTSSTASLGSSLLEDWYDHVHDESQTPTGHIEFPTPLEENQPQQQPRTNVWMDQVAALVGVLAVCFFFYLQHQFFHAKEN